MATCPPYVSDPRVCAFNDTTNGISFATFFLAPAFLLHYQKHPVISPRIPTLVVAGIMSNMFKVWSISCLYGHWWKIFDPFPCWFASSLYDGIDFPMRMVITARSVMLLLQNASKANKNLKEKRPYLYMYIKAIAKVTCPSFYVALVNRVENQLEKVEVHHFKFWHQWRETLLFCIWYAFGFFVMIMDSLRSSGAAETGKLMGEGSVCWISHLVLLGWWQVIWSVLNLPILYGVIFYAEDKIGYQMEIMFFQILDILAALISGQALIRREKSGDLSNHLMDKLGLLIPPLLWFIFPLFYVIAFKTRQVRRNSLTARTSEGSSANRMRRKSSHNGKLGNNVQSFEKFWSEGGADLVTEIAEQYYMGEMAAFLKEMDLEIQQGFKFEGFAHIHSRYVAEGSPFQLNLPALLFKRWQDAMSKQLTELDILQETRKIVVRLLLDNIGRPIRDAIGENDHETRAKTIDAPRSVSQAPTAVDLPKRSSSSNVPEFSI
jgi:hypothetical protein